MTTDALKAALAGLTPEAALAALAAAAADIQAGIAPAENTAPPVSGTPAHFTYSSTDHRPARESQSPASLDDPASFGSQEYELCDISEAKKSNYQPPDLLHHPAARAHAGCIVGHVHALNSLSDVEETALKLLAWCYCVARLLIFGTCKTASPPSAHATITTSGRPNYSAETQRPRHQTHSAADSQGPPRRLSISLI